MDIKHPEIMVELIGHDSNAFNVLGRVARAMREAGLDKAEIAAYLEEAQAGDYRHLLAVTMRWVEVA